MPPGMQPNQVPRVQTVTFRDQMVGAFANEWRLRFHEQPTAEILALLCAHWATETGRGQRMYNWNPGNLTTRSGDYYLNGDPKYHYKSYSDIFAGVDGLLDWIFNHPGVMSALRTGDARVYAHALKEAHYYEADEASYAHNLYSISTEYLPAIKALLSPVSGLPAWPGGWRLLTQLTPAIVAKAKECLRTLPLRTQRTFDIDGKLILFNKQDSNGKVIVTAWESKS